MQITSFETSIVNGQIQVPAGIELPENARLVVTVAAHLPRMSSPRLADPSQVNDFDIQVADDMMVDLSL